MTNIAKRITGKKKKCKIIVLCLLFLLGFVAGGGNDSARCVHAEESGYSQEEKEQAKAWLSAHGYAPTRAGAQQAYQDYLNGKFDGEPGVPPVNSQNNKTKYSATTQNNTKDSSTSEKAEKTQEQSEKNPDAQGKVTETTTASQTTKDHSQSTTAETKEKATTQVTKRRKKISKKTSVTTKEKTSYMAYIVTGVIVLVVLLASVIFLVTDARKNHDQK